MRSRLVHGVSRCLAPLSRQRDPSARSRHLVRSVPACARRHGRHGPPVPLAGPGLDELAFFDDGLVRFNTIEVVSGAVPPNQGNGLGPRFNSTSCGSCHSQPYIGGSSPAQNPLMTHTIEDGRATRFSVVPGRRSRTHPRGSIRPVERRSGRRSAQPVRCERPRGCRAVAAIQQPVFHARRQCPLHQVVAETRMHRVSHSDADLGCRTDRGHSGLRDSRGNMAANAGPALQLGVSGHANAILDGNTNLSANDEDDCALRLEGTEPNPS